MRITVLAGPPCAGKTTTARELAQHGDVILDLDAIAQELGSPNQWQHEYRYRAAAETEMQRRIEHAHRHHSNGTAWVIRSAPDGLHRQHLADRYDASIMLLMPEQTECIQRASDRPEGTHQAIEQWYANYTPRQDDQRG